jgi:hypothetical protein
MKLFKLVKEIRSKLGVIHFRRYAIIETKWFGLYIHRIYKADADKHLHSHPWNFKSIILKGSYAEAYNGIDIFGEPQTYIRTREFLDYSSANTDYFHKILNIIKGPVTTLFFTYGVHREWYYLVNGEKIESTKYRIMKNEGKFIVLDKTPVV